MQVLGLTVVYLAAAHLGFLAAPAHQAVSSVWPPAGIAVAALLVFGPRIWPGITLGALLANLTASVAWPAALAIGVGNTLEAIRSGAGGRISEGNQSQKKHPADFMLWKSDPSHIMKWPSPWGEGYPGWHIECSVMALERLAGGGGGGGEGEGRDERHEGKKDKKRERRGRGVKGRRKII